MEGPGRPAAPARPEPETAELIPINSPENQRRRIQAQCVMVTAMLRQAASSGCRFGALTATAAVWRRPSGRARGGCKVSEKCPSVLE